MINEHIIFKFCGSLGELSKTRGIIQRKEVHQKYVVFSCEDFMCDLIFFFRIDYALNISKTFQVRKIAVFKNCGSRH